MAGFFGFFNYNKEGPGVYLNEPPKGPFKTFFGILGRKFWKVININMMYVIFSIPALIVGFLAVGVLVPQVFPALGLENFQKLITDTTSELSGSVSSRVSDISSGLISGAQEGQVLTPQESAGLVYSQIMMILSFVLVGAQLFVFGPVHAGITYLFRNYAREEHAFLWGDFSEHTKRNWKQALVSALIGFFGVFIVFTGFSFYSNPEIIQNNFLRSILQGFMILVFVIFMMMQMYIYPMIVTFKLNIKQIYKNAFLFVMARLPFNVGISLISLLLMGIIPLLLLLFVGSGLILILLIFYYFFLAFGLNLLMTNFFVYRQLQKFMIDPYEAEQEAMQESTKDDREEIQAIFKDTKPDGEDS